MAEANEARMRLVLSARDRETDVGFDACMANQGADGGISKSEPSHFVGLDERASVQRVRECMGNAQLEVVSDPVGGHACGMLAWMGPGFALLGS